MFRAGPGAAGGPRSVGPPPGSPPRRGEEGPAARVFPAPPLPAPARGSGWRGSRKRWVTAALLPGTHTRASPELLSSFHLLASPLPGPSLLSRPGSQGWSLSFTKPD